MDCEPASYLFILTTPIVLTTVCPSAPVYYFSFTVGFFPGLITVLLLRSFGLGISAERPSQKRNLNVARV
jgi:hypothetical protein